MGRNYQLQVNVPPNKDGLIDDKDVKVLEEFGQYEFSSLVLLFLAGLMSPSRSMRPSRLPRSLPPRMLTSVPL